MSVSPQFVPSKPRRQMQDSDWWVLINSIKEKKLIPVIGPDLIRVPLSGESVTYERYIARKLSAHPDYGLTDDDFLNFGIVPGEANLNDVVSICVAKHPEHWPFELHAQVWQIVNDSQFPVPPAVARLAEIVPIELFVSATFDPLLANALRNLGPLEEMTYRRSDRGDPADLPRDMRKGNRRFVYYLFGKAERGREDFAICEVELLRTLVKLHDAKFRPKRLFDALRENHLLMLGVNFSDWLARFFLWLAKDRGNVGFQHQDLREYLDDPKVGQDRSLMMFLHHFSNSTVVVEDEPEEFVFELYRRWAETTKIGSGTSDTSAWEPPREIPKDAVFLSYSRPDRNCVEALYTALTRESIPAWYDAGLSGGDLWEEKIRRYIDNCAVFVPVISTEALGRARSEFRAEWQQAVDLNRRRFGTGLTTIVPVIVDEEDNIIRVPNAFDTLPLEFARAQMYHCPRGEPSRDLINALRALLKKP